MNDEVYYFGAGAAATAVAAVAASFVSLRGSEGAVKTRERAVLLPDTGPASATKSPCSSPCTVPVTQRGVAPAHKRSQKTRVILVHIKEGA